MLAGTIGNHSSNGVARNGGVARHTCTARVAALTCTVGAAGLTMAGVSTLATAGVSALTIRPDLLHLPWPESLDFEALLDSNLNQS